MPDVNYDAYNPLTPKGDYRCHTVSNAEWDWLDEMLHSIQYVTIEPVACVKLIEHWIANKVKVFPCDVGDPGYFIIEDTNETYISEDRITDVSTKGFFCSSTIGGCDSDDFYPYSDLGEIAFLNKKEAEIAVKERGK